MMHTGKRVLLAAGLIAGAAALTGCSAVTKPVTTPTPQIQKVTAQPADAQPEAMQQNENEATDGQADALEAETPEGGESERLTLSVEGKAVTAGAFKENDLLMLPITQTAQALGWSAESEETGEQPQQKRVITLKQGDSRITVSWTVSDNTTKGITWQKDGLLIPVDTKLTTLEDVVYVPSAFFEEAMNAVITQEGDSVSVHANRPEDTPEMDVKETEGNS